jgi:hypothetical protein
VTTDYHVVMFLVNSTEIEGAFECKMCAELWHGLVARKLIHIAKFVTGRVAVVGSLWGHSVARIWLDRFHSSNCFLLAA